MLQEARLIAGAGGGDGVTPGAFGDLLAGAGTPTGGMWQEGLRYYPLRFFWQNFDPPRCHLASNSASPIFHSCDLLSLTKTE